VLHVAFGQIGQQQLPSPAERLHEYQRQRNDQQQDGKCDAQCDQ
jgi:hypothetical protein